MVDKSCVLQIFGALMKHPQYLSESDKYNLTPDDFYYRLDKFVFVAIDSLYRNGAERVHPIDVENYLNTNDGARVLFKQLNGIKYLQDAESLSDEGNFPYYYKKLKKFNLLESFKEKGFDTNEFYVEEALTKEAIEVNKKFETLEVSDIIDLMKAKLLGVERQFIQNDTTETINVFEGMKEILEEAKESTNVGVPLQGEIFNEVCMGARRGIFVLRSGGSGVGKTRQAVGDACYIAFPFRYEIDKDKWVQTGSGKKVLFITTEQTPKEVQTIILSYLTGINETKFKYGGDFSDKEKRIIAQALWVLEQYQDNFYIIRMPNPTIELVKTLVRENVLMHDIEYVFYDYIHISPSLLKEFNGFHLRNDEILLMFSTALKDLAVEQNVFMMSSTQVNANSDKNEDIRNESSLAGSRSIINKADIGVICARPTKEELELFQNEGGLSFFPTMVYDVFKVRAGRWNQIRIWSDVDLGTVRKKDLFATDSRMEVIKGFGAEFNYVPNWETDEEKTYLEQLKFVNELTLEG